MKTKNILSVLALSTLLVSGAAKADRFVYHDPDYGYTLSYPDDWRLNVPDSGTERVRIAPMHGQDGVECSMSAVRDGRLTIYPERLMDDAVPLTLDESFWAQNVLPDYPNHHVLKYHAPAGLGQGYASSVQIIWNNLLVGSPITVTDVLAPGETPEPIGMQGYDTVTDDMVTSNPAETMRAAMVATIYDGNRYRFTCQSNAAVYEDWQPLFGSILSSVRFDERYAMVPSGYYRDFLSDKPLLSGNPLLTR